MLHPVTSRDSWPPAHATWRGVPASCSRHENWAAWLLSHWEEVGIVDGVRSLEWVAGRPRLHAEVSVVLGSLLPGDVRVELLPLEPLPDDHPLAHGRVMMRTARLRHERYWFALNTPAEPEDGERRWIVRVRPARSLVGIGDVAPVDLELDPVLAGSSRRRLRQTAPRVRGSFLET